MAVESQVKWHGERYTKELRAGLVERLDVVGQELVRATKKNLGTPFPPASLPGEFPHKRKGTLQKGIGYRLNKRELAVTIISAAKHSKFLENGTRKMKPRQFARRTLREMRSTIRAIMLGTSLNRGRFKFTK